MIVEIELFHLKYNEPFEIQDKTECSKIIRTKQTAWTVSQTLPSTK